MRRDDVLMIFRELISRNRDEIIYSTGYKLFDEMFEIFEEFGLTKREEGRYTIVTRLENC